MKNWIGSFFQTAVWIIFIFCIPVYALQIESVEINQVLGIQKDNHYNFVAGKDTVVRAFLSEEVVVDQTNSSAQVYRDNNLVATLSAKSYDKPTKTVDFLCRNRTDCGNWAAGTYQFNVKVNGVEKSEPAQGASSSYIFKERKKLRILAIPVKANYNGVITQLPNDKWKSMYAFTAKVYPVAEDQLIWETRGEFDASAEKYNLETDAGQSQLWQDLTNLMPLSCAKDPNGEGCYDLIVGFISDRPNTYPNGRLQGFTYGKPTNIVVATDEDAPATVAHEIAHVFGVGDTYNGGSLRCSVNPAPDGFTGRNWDNPESMTSCSQGRMALDQISATKIPKEVHPYEVGGRGELGDMACYMGSGGLLNQFWTSQETYDHLFEQLVPPVRSATHLKSALSTQRFIHFFGYIDEAGSTRIEPWESFSDTAEISDSTGTYTLSAIDASSAVLASRKLDPQFYILSTPPEPIKKIDWAPFEGAMRFPDNTSAFVITKNNELLASIPVSAHIPMINSVTPLVSTSITGNYTISWSASDADNDILTYSVEYNPNINHAESPWIVLTGDTDTQLWEENFSELPGGDHAKIRVTATDGILSATGESAEFTVPFKAPEIFINDPEWGDSYEEGDEVLLSAESADLQDDVIAADNLQWTSNLDGPIGTGPQIITDSLRMGEHTITLTATNSAGLNATGSITIKVGNITYDFIPNENGNSNDTLLSNHYKELNTDIKIPKQAVDADTFIMFEALAQPSTTTRPPGLATFGRFFSLNAQTASSDDQWNHVDSLNAPVTVTIDYAKDLPSSVNGDTLRIYRYNQSSGQWQDIEAENAVGTSTYDRSQTGKLTAIVSKFGEFAVVGDSRSTSSSSNCFINTSFF